MKIFWSWQSDTDGKTGRFFVRDCIAAAIKHLKASDDVEEPTEREALDAMHLDHDRKGIPGSPDLARAILDKIDAASVVIADVTVVSKAPGGKRPDGKRVKGRRFINPNVGIELGYALKALGDASTLLVMNSHHGTADDLPFDLRHKGVSLVYELAPGADKSAIEAERTRLVAALVPALKHYVTRNAPPKEPQFNGWPAKRSPVFYFDREEALATAGVQNVDEIAFGMMAMRAISLRLIPNGRRERPLSPRELRERVDARLGPFWIRGLTGIAALNEYGAIVHEPLSHGQPFNEIKALTQVFPTGEMWGINTWLLRDRPEYGPHTILPALPFEKTCYDTLHRYVRFACDQLGLQPPFEFEGAMTGTKKVYLAFEEQQEWGPIHQDAVIHRAVLTAADAASVSAVLLSFFEAVYDQTSYARPNGLFGFPPDPPNEAAWRKSGLGPG